MSRVDADALAPAEPEPAAEPTAGGDGRTRRWDSHRLARRNELTRAARRAVHHGGADLSMDEIAAAIGTSKSILYRYFGDRSGLQTAVGEAVLEDLGAALAQASRGASDPRQALHAMVTVYLEMISSAPAVYSFVTHGGDVSDPTAPLRTLADDAAALLVPVLGDVLDAAGRGRDLARIWAAGVIGFVRGGAEVWLAAARADSGAPDGLGVAPQALAALAAEMTDWLCRGTALRPDLPEHP